MVNTVYKVILHEIIGVYKNTMRDVIAIILYE